MEIFENNPAYEIISDLTSEYNKLKGAFAVKEYIMQCFSGRLLPEEVIPELQALIDKVDEIILKRSDDFAKAIYDFKS